MAGRPWSDATPANAERVRELTRMMELKALGYTHAQIAEQFGISVRAVSGRLERFLKTLPRQGAQDLAAVAAIRLDGLELKAREVMENPKANPYQMLRAIEVIVSIEARRAKMLGYDKADLQELQEAARQLTAEQSQAAAAGLNRIMAALDLTPEQRAKLPELMSREFRRAQADQSEVIQGELEGQPDEGYVNLPSESLSTNLTS